MQEIIHPRSLNIDTSDRTSDTPRPRLLHAAAVLLFLFDRLFKAVVLSLPLKSPSGGAVEFNLFKNTGMIFSIAVPEIPLLMISIVIFAGFAAALMIALKRKSYLSPLLTLVVLGAASNLIDRFVYGGVIDYVILFGRSAINLADIMIVVGVAMLLLAYRKGRWSTGTEEIRP